MQRLISTLLTTTGNGLGASMASAQETSDAALVFEPAAYETISVTIDGVPVTLRRYRVVYVADGLPPEKWSSLK